MREMFDSSVERLFADLSTPAAVLACESGAWPATLWSAVEESGFPFALVPEALGGAGAGWADVCGVLRLAGRFNLPLPLAETMLANWLLGTVGIEPVTGAVSVATSGTLTLHEGKASGSVTEVPWGRHVKAIVAVTADNAPSVVVLPVEAARVTASNNTASEPRDTLAFTSATPIAAAPLPSGQPRDVLKLGGAMLRAAQIAGALEAVLAMATLYASERVQFGKTIGSFQAIQHQVAVLAEHAAASVMAAEAAFAQSGEQLARLPAMVARICASDAAGIGASVAHAVHGAIGFTHEHALHLTTRRLWAWRSEFGSSTDWSQQLGRAICDAGSSAFWPAVTANRLPAQETSLA